MLKFGIDLLSGNPSLLENQHKICSHSGYEPNGFPRPQSPSQVNPCPELSKNERYINKKKTKVNVKCDSWIRLLS